MRLFIAWWPGPRTREALVAERLRWDWPGTARLSPDAGLHITLHFLGERPEAQLPALRAMLLGLPPRHAELVLDQRAVWPQGVAALIASAVSPAAAALHHELAQRLHALGIDADTRAWRPHVTLARHARGAAPPEAPPLRLRWPLRSPVLVQSPAGAGPYRVLTGPGAQSPMA